MPKIHSRSAMGREHLMPLAVHGVGTKSRSVRVVARSFRARLLMRRVNSLVGYFGVIWTTLQLGDRSKYF